MLLLVRFYDLTALTAFAAMVVCVTIEVVARNLIHMPTTWVEESSRLFFLYSIFMGSASAWYRKRHIVINVLPNRMTGRPKQVLTVLVNLTTGIFLLCVWAGTLYVILTNRGAISTALEIDLGWFYLSILAGLTGMIIFHFSQMIEESRRHPREKDLKDGAAS